MTNPPTPVFLTPWLDRAGRLSPLKLLTFIALFGPALWIIVQWRFSWLGSKPVTEAIHQTGTWAVRFLLLSLAVTPLRFIGAWPKLFLVRRMLGLAALGYVLLHLTLFFVQEGYDLWRVVSEIVLRFYLTIGFVALLGFIALGVTSTDAMVRRMGAAWHRLHRVIYFIAVLALLHFFIQSKIDVTEAVFMAGLFLLLMGYRLLKRFEFEFSPSVLFATAVAVGFLTMLLEMLWYGAATGVPPLRVLAANLDFSFTVRPGWWVAVSGAALAGLRFLRPPANPRRLKQTVARKIVGATDGVDNDMEKARAAKPAL